MKPVENLIDYVFQDRISIMNPNKKKHQMLKQLGAKRKWLTWSEWILPYGSKKDLAEKFSCLRDEDFLFAVGAHGWPPAVVFRELRDRGLIEGKAQEITWYNPEKYHISEF